MPCCGSGGYDFGFLYVGQEGRGSGFAHAVAFECYAVGIVYEAVEDGVSDRVRIPMIPAACSNLIPAIIPI